MKFIYFALLFKILKTSLQNNVEVLVDDFTNSNFMNKFSEIKLEGKYTTGEFILNTYNRIDGIKIKLDNSFLKRDIICENIFKIEARYLSYISMSFHLGIKQAITI
jgi:hypothetical protein